MEETLTSKVAKHATLPRMAVLCFLVLGVINVISHEMWRDELQAWNIASESRTLGELMSNIRYEGHPSLWYLCLYFLTKATPNPMAMQVFHLLLATAAIAIFLKCAPFSKLQKCLFIFGYFPLFEYAAISRMYVLGILLSFAFLALRKKKPWNWLLSSCILALLAQTSVYGVILTVAFAAVWFFEILLNRDFLATPNREKAVAILSMAIVVFGILVAVLQMIPPPDSGYAQGWMFQYSTERLLLALSNVWKSYVPIPRLAMTFWGYMGNDNVLTSQTLQWVFSVALLTLTGLIFVNRPSAFFQWLIGNIGLLGFAYIKDFGFIRHYGHLYVLLVAALWMSYSSPGAGQEMGYSRSFSRVISSLRRHVTTIIFTIHLIAVIHPIAMDWLHPFSSSKEIADFIKEKELANMIIVSDRDWSGVSVAGYLGRKLYFPRTDRFGSFIIWDKAWADWRYWSIDYVLHRARDLAKDGQRNVLVMLDYRLTQKQQYAYALSELTRSKRSIVPDESYYLYLVSAGINEKQETSNRACREFYFREGRNFIVDGQFQIAEKLFGIAQERNPKAGNLVGISLILFMKGDRESAISFYREALWLKANKYEHGNCSPPQGFSDDPRAFLADILRAGQSQKIADYIGFITSITSGDKWGLRALLEVYSQRSLVEKKQAFPKTMNDLSDKWLFLSDLHPVRVFQEVGTLQFDANVNGSTIILNNVIYEKGLGTHANSEITFDVNKKVAFFESDIGLDDTEDTSTGSVVFEVLVDGKLAYRSHIMRWHSKTRHIRVSIGGSKKLILRVRDGGDGSRNDHASWANALVY